VPTIRRLIPILFKNSTFGKLLNIPDPRVLPSDAEGLSVSFVFVGDEAQCINIISVIPDTINKKINIPFSF